MAYDVGTVSQGASAPKEPRKKQTEMKPRKDWFKNEAVSVFADRKTRLYLIGALILLVGLGTALMLHLTCEDVSNNDLVRQIHSGKRYRHDLQVMGGQIYLLADDLSVWFEGLWQDRALSGTVATATVFLSLGFFLVAYHLPADPSSDA